jgi:hypothetical protein
MLDLMAGDARLRRRLDAYAEFRLSPDLATSSRIRARVLAAAHRRSDLARADAALTIVTAATSPRLTARSRRPWRRAAAGLLAASLALGVVAGTAFATRPSGALYEPRLWLETVTLPDEPSRRALAELDRLELRLDEVTDALRAGDPAAAEAALRAYETIIDQAFSAAIASQDEVAAAVLEAGVGHNVGVLQALIAALPDEAADQAAAALQRAIDRSDRAILRIDRGGTPTSGPNTDSGGPGVKPTKGPTSEPTPKPTGKPAGGPSGGGAGGQPAATSEPGKPAKSPKPSPQHGPG